MGGADIGTLIQKELVAASEGINEVEEHREQNKNGKNDHIWRDEDIGHAGHAGEFLYPREQAVENADDDVCEYRQRASWWTASL